MLVRFLGKLTLSVLIIWLGIGVSLAALYPLSDNIQDQQTGIGSGNLHLGPGQSNFQNDDGSGNSQSDTGSGNVVTGDDSGNSQSGTGSGDSQSGDNSGNPQPGNSAGKKYLVDNFFLNTTNFTAEITNPKNVVTGDGFYEIKIKSAANHKDVLQSGTFLHSLGTFTIGDSLDFTPKDGEKYHILVYTNYPNDNRVSKDEYKYRPESNEES